MCAAAGMRPLRALALLALAAILLLPMACAREVPGTGFPGAGDPEIQAILREVASRHQVVGLGAGIVRPAGDAATAVVGWSRAGGATRIGLDDLWHIGSCTKAMTATLAAKLVEEGTLSWQTTVGEVFPELASTLGGTKRGITLEQLLSHRAGLPREYGHSPFLLLRSPTGQRLSVLRQLPSTELVAEPGVRYSYSNFGYSVIGAMVERRAGRPFEDVVRTRLFAPLQMTRTEYEGDHVFGRGGVIWSHRPDGTPVGRWFRPVNDTGALHPAGSVRASLGDWARFLRHHLVGEAGGSDYLRADTYRELHRSRGEEYALGWAVFERDWGGGTVLQHAGSNGWNYSLVWVAPRKGFAVFSCVNQGDRRKVLDEITDRLLALVARRYPPTG